MSVGVEEYFDVFLLSGRKLGEKVAYHAGREGCQHVMVRAVVGKPVQQLISRESNL